MTLQDSGFGQLLFLTAALQRKQKMNLNDQTPAAAYVKSLRDPLKRRFAVDYLTWLRAGRRGDMPSRGKLPSAISQAVCLNLEALG